MWKQLLQNICGNAPPSPNGGAIHMPPMNDCRLSLTLFRFLVESFCKLTWVPEVLNHIFRTNIFICRLRVQSNEMFVRFLKGGNCRIEWNNQIPKLNWFQTSFGTRLSSVVIFYWNLFRRKLSCDRSHLHKRNLPALCQSKFKKCFFFCFLFVLYLWDKHVPKRSA